MSICTACMLHSYVERWGGCGDECHEIVIWQASPRCGINSLSHLSLMSWTDIYRVTRCVLGRSGVTAAGIYALRLLKAGCASSANGSLRPLCDRFRAENFHDEGPPLCDGCRAWFFHIDKTTPARRTTPGSSMREAKISEGPPAFKDSIAQMAGKMVFVQFI